MEAEDLCSDLLAIAEAQLTQIVEDFPQDNNRRFAFFVEAMRVLDNFSFGSMKMSDDFPRSAVDIDVLRMGWNLVTSHLFVRFDSKGVPIFPETDETKEYTTRLLWRCGCVVLIRRLIDLVDVGLMTVKRQGDQYSFEMQNRRAITYDLIEFLIYHNLNVRIRNTTSSQFNQWNLFEFADLQSKMNEPGSHLFINRKPEIEKFKLEDIDEKLLPLIRLVDYGRGVLLKYDSTPEINDHFFAKASDLVFKWRDDAGLMPETKIGGLTGAQLMTVALGITGLQLRHLGFVSTALKHFPALSVFRNLTVLNPIPEMIDELCDFFKMDKGAIESVVNSLLFVPADAQLLKSHTSVFMPLLIEAGQGGVIRPVSSIFINPFYAILDLLIYRDRNVEKEISSHRELWLRSHIYSIFQGNRYQCVSGNVKLTTGNLTVTDIDAAVYDNTTGELAIFQLKWQNFHYNDIRKLGSRAKNLVAELDGWVNKVNDWIGTNGMEKLLNNLRISPKKRINTQVFLFAVSRSQANMSGYGYELQSKDLAVCNWPQLSRNRTEIGPHQNVIQSLFKSLKEQEIRTEKKIPIPLTFSMGDAEVVVKNLWTKIEIGALDATEARE